MTIGIRMTLHRPYDKKNKLKIINDKVLAIWDQYKVDIYTNEVLHACQGVLQAVPIMAHWPRPFLNFTL